MKQALYLILLFSSLFLSCKDEDDTIIDPFQGTDNFIRSLSLTVNNIEYKATIAGDSISLIVPPATSINGAKVSYELAEQTSISPEPKTIENWEQAMEFVVTSHSGEKRIYHYIFLQRDLESEGDIFLQTQAEVDAFAQTGITIIQGNLFLGLKNEQSITNLKGLKFLKKISGTLDFVNCQGCQTLEGLESLEELGRVYVKDNLEAYEDRRIDLISIKLPSLRKVYSDFYLFPRTTIQHIDLKNLEYVGGDLYLNGTCKTFELPSFKYCNGEFSVNMYDAEQTLVFPELLYAANLILATHMNSEFPKLTEAGQIKIFDSKVKMPMLEKCVDFKCTNVLCDELPTLQTITNSICNVASAPVLTKVGGHIDNLLSTPTLSSFPTLMFVGGSVNWAQCPLLTEVAGDVSNCNCPKLQTVKGVVSAVTFKELKNYPILRNVGGIKISTGTEDDKVWDFTPWQIGEKGIALSIGGNAPEKIIGPQELNGMFSLYTNKSISTDIRGFVDIKSLDILSESSQPFDFQLPDVKNIQENCTIFCWTTSLPSLESVGGHLYLLTNQALVPKLTTIGKRFTWESYWILPQINPEYLLDFPKLETVGDNSLANSQVCFYLKEYACRKYSFPSLKAVHGRMTIGGEGNDIPSHRLTEEISMPSLETIDGKLTIGVSYSGYENPNLAKIDMKTLAKVGGVTIKDQPSLKDFSTFSRVIPGLDAALWRISGCGYNPTWQDMADGKHIGQ